MRKVWEVIQNIFMIPLLVLEWVWDLIPSNGAMKWFKAEGFAWFLIICGIALVITGALFTEGWWLLAVWIGVTTFIGIAERDSRSFDDNFGISFLLSVLIIALTSALVYGYGFVIGFDEVKKDVIAYQARNISYIADPNDKYILLNKNTMVQHRMPMKQFYEMRESGCKEVHKTQTEIKPKLFHEKFGKTTNIKYTCVVKAQ